MRFFIPLALLGATTVVAQDQSLRQILEDAVPECMQSCVSDAYESATSCSLDDTNCICSADSQAFSEDTINSLVGDLQQCMKDNCEASDLTDLSSDKLNSALSDAQSVCDGTGAAVTFSPSNILLGAGALMVVAAI
ncbi:hypothetical protein BDW62DRAFT_187683 [Aspergillus aurantiobrunneus]